MPLRNPKVWVTTDISEEGPIVINDKLKMAISTDFYPHRDIGARLQNQTHILRHMFIGKEGGNFDEQHLL